MKSFERAIYQLLWPEKRPGNIGYVTASGKTLKGQVDVTTETSYLRVPWGFLPDFLRPFVEALAGTKFVTDDGLQLGPIPAGTPVNLLAGIDLDKIAGPIDELEHRLQILELLKQLAKDLKSLPANASDEQARHVFGNAVDQFLALDKCPDFIQQRPLFWDRLFQGRAGTHGRRQAGSDRISENLLNCGLRLGQCANMSGGV